MKKLILITILFYLGVIHTGFNMYTNKTNHKSIYYFKDLIFNESSNNSFAISEKGAIGIAQITKSVIDDHNTFHNCGKNYSLKEMYVFYSGLHVGKWQAERLKRYYMCDVKSVSAYNMGIGNTDNGVINFRYAFKILGTNKVLSWLNKRKVKPWKGTSTCYYVLD